MTALLTNATSEVESDPVELSEGINTFFIDGPFDGATVLLSTALTSDGQYEVSDRYEFPCRVNVDVSGACFLKAKLIQVGSDTSVSVTKL